MENRHSASGASLLFHLQMSSAAAEAEATGEAADAKGRGKIPPTNSGESFERVAKVFEAAGGTSALTLANGLCREALRGRLFIVDGSGKKDEIVFGPVSSALQQGDFELPETDAGEPIALFASFLERYLSLFPRSDIMSPLKQASVGPGSPPQLAEAFGKHSLNQKYDYLDFYEKALEVGVQTYACIPMARFYRLLKNVEEARRDKIESSLGPNLCMLLEQVRISDKDSQPEDGAEEDNCSERKNGAGQNIAANDDDDDDEGSKGDGTSFKLGIDEDGDDDGGPGSRSILGDEFIEEVCATLTATSAPDLSSLKVSRNQKPLNMLRSKAPRRSKQKGKWRKGEPAAAAAGGPDGSSNGDNGDDNDDDKGKKAAAALKQPEEIMLVCISTAKMLLTIQANKNNNNVRMVVDASDILEVAESSEYAYFSEATSELAHVDPSSLPQKQRAVFFINLYNLMILHAALEKARWRKKGDSKTRWLPRASPFGWMKFLRSATYNVGGNIYSALDVEHSILRSSRPNNDNVFIGRLLGRLPSNDPRLKCKVNQEIPLLTFALCPGTMCSPPLKCFHEHNFEEELVRSAETFLSKYCHAQVCERSSRSSWSKKSNASSSLSVAEAAAALKAAKSSSAPASSSFVLEVRLPLLLKWYRHDLGGGAAAGGGSGGTGGKNSTKWLLSIASLIKGTKASHCILEAIDAAMPIDLKYDTYKWELGWMLQES